MFYFRFVIVDALLYVNIDQGIHYNKSNVSRNENQKPKKGFLIQKFGKNLKSFSTAFHQAQTLILLGVWLFIYREQI